MDSHHNVEHVRRVVTGAAADGRSTVVADDQLFLEEVTQVPHLRSARVWQTKDPLTIGAELDGNCAGDTRMTPAPGATLVLFSLFAPHSTGVEWAGFPPDVTSEAGIADVDVRRGFHRTNSVDYCIVIHGELHAILDRGEVRLTPGSVLVQGGVAHAWENRGPVPCLVAFVMVGALRK